MKRIAIFLFSALLSLASCSGETGQEAQRHPLEAFAVRIGDSYYHARIDQESHVATIGHITRKGRTTTKIVESVLSISFALFHLSKNDLRRD